ncbi:hypothetical protein KUTeg_024802 [Tegillarca granosa]|uniref:KCTD1_15 n=1 Tax=Tegillarca granosa TaxID=220873 RepID=A0ABQ9E3H2_TEGGR|nr:hypothetical protein KUTeg_024802 [Tegillarca granosa]
MATSRFGSSSQTDLQLIMQGKDAENTKRATQASVKILQIYLMETEREINLDSNSKEDLAQLLRNFYADVRKKDGQKYKLSALKSIRFGLARHFSKEYDIDIVKDTTFKKANELFSAVLINLKKEGFGKTDYTAPIPAGELKKLYCSRAFDINTPVGLQQKTWFGLMFFLCRRGRENLRCMNKNTFAIAKDYRGLEYIYQARDELDKNHRENDSPMENPTEGRMFEKPGSDKCPLMSFKKYLSKLNKNCDDLWQRLKDSFYDDSEECNDMFDVEEVQINEFINGNNIDPPVSKESQNVTSPQQTLSSHNITSNVLKQIENVSNCPAAYITGSVVNFTVNSNK